MSTLAIIPCGKQKIWSKYPNKGPTNAEKVYISAYFKVNKSYAERFSDKWLILSAKYGLLSPDFTIKSDYNVTFNDKSTGPISILELSEHAKSYHEYNLIVALGGKKYTNIIDKIFSQGGTKIVKPVEGLNLFESMAKLKKAVRSGIPL